MPLAPATRTRPSPLRVARLSAGLGLRLILAYRLEVLITIVSASVVALLNWSLWTAIFQGRSEVAGRGLSELTTYVVVAYQSSADPARRTATAAGLPGRRNWRPSTPSRRRR